MHRSFPLFAVLSLALSFPATADDLATEPLTPRTGIIVFGDRTLELAAFPVCSGSPHGAYNIWLVTPDEDEPDVPKEGAPRLHAISDGEMSVLEFHPGDGEAPLYVRGQGEDYLPFQDGELHYNGPIGEDAAQQIEVHVKC